MHPSRLNGYQNNFGAPYPIDAHPDQSQHLAAVVTHREPTVDLRCAQINSAESHISPVIGHPTRAGREDMLPFHSVPKWKWWLMDVGIRLFKQADD